MGAALIISQDAEFSQALAEQLQQELGLASDVLPQLEVVPDGVNLLISHEEIGVSAACPAVLLPKSEAPYRMRAILSQIRAALATPQEETLAITQDLTLHCRLKQLKHSASGAQADLTDKETQLLAQLAKAGKAGLSREALLKNVWGIASALDTHTLETHIYRLRGKIKELVQRDVIEASEGGYVLDA